MEMADLAKEHEASYCKCLEDWSEELAEAGTLKESWLARKLQRGRG
jgi:hypothetical protein